MTLKYPEVCPQQLVEPWWEEYSGEDFKPGRLVYAFLPHVDQTPLRIEPVGRKDPTDHVSGFINVKRFRIGDPIIKKNDLPLAAMPVYDNETLSVYRTKRRPAIIISKGGPFIDGKMTAGKSKWRTNPTILAVPSYSVRNAYSLAFCERVRRCEYPQFLWDDLPIGGTQKGSIFRFDHLQPIGRSPKSVQFTKYCLSEKAMIFLMGLVEWLVSGYMDPDSKFCEIRTFLMQY